MSSRTPHSDVFSLDFLERSCGLVPSRESLFDDIEDLNCGEFRQLADSLKHVGTTNGEIVVFIL